MRKINDEQIINDNICLPVMGKDGNVEYETYTYKSALVGLDGKKISKDYFYMKWLFNDHYIVGDITTMQMSMDSVDEFISNKVVFKYGIIRLERDFEGNIIPNCETLVMPLIYDEIIMNQSNILLAKVNQKYTYIDMNIDSCNYGKQLVPAVLEYVEPFDVEYKGYAKCTLDRVTGYLPFVVVPQRELLASQLLTEEQVVKKCLISSMEYPNNDDNLSNYVKTLKFSAIKID